MSGIFDSWYGILLYTIAMAMGGFLIGAVVFLGHGQARTTDDVRAGLAADRHAASRRHCTAVTARWCPLHGECTCRIDGPDEDELRETNMDNRSCPLHGHNSLHGAT